MSVEVRDARGVIRTVATIDDLLAGLLAVSVQKTAGTTTWTRDTLALDGNSQQLVAADADRCGLVIQNRSGNGRIDFDPAGGTLAAGEGWQILGGDPPVSLLGAECPTGVVTILGTAGDVVTFWELA